MTELEQQLQALREPTHPLPVPPLASVRAIGGGGGGDRRRVGWLVAASLILLALVGGTFALGRGRETRKFSSTAAAIGGSSVVTFGATAPATPEQLDQAAIVMQSRLRTLGIEGSTVERRGDATIVATVPDGVAADGLALLAEPGRVELRPVLDEGPSASGAPPGTGVPDPPLVPGADGTSVVDDGQSRLVLGPGGMTGSFERATAYLDRPSQRWIVNPILRSGDELDAFNELVGQCYRKDAECPTGRLALVLDGRLVSAPSINAPSLTSEQIEISANFTEAQAKELAALMGSGELPVELQAR